MAVSIVMPALEMAQETGKLLSWLKREGDSVKKGEPLVEIETDKVVVEIEAPENGVLAGIKSREGAVVPVGQTIAWIVAPGETPPAETAADTAVQAMAAQARHSGSAPAAAAASPAVQTPPARGPRISPKARRIAEERGVDITRITGTGPDGAITGDDVLRAAAPSPAPQHSPALSSIARLMAERTTQSWTQAPHFFLARDIDAGKLLEAREWFSPSIERSHKVKLTVTDVLVALVARALEKHPKMNGTWTGDAIRLNPEINISVAMAVKDGVVGAVIHGAAKASLAEIAVQRRDLTERARTGKLHPPDVTGGTFTVSNLGMYGIDAFSAIITPPQAAVLAVGRISDRVVPVNGQPGIRPMLTVTLSSDHRVVDGAQAAEFLKDFASAAAAPNLWI